MAIETADAIGSGRQCKYGADLVRLSGSMGESGRAVRVVLGTYLASIVRAYR